MRVSTVVNVFLIRFAIQFLPHAVFSGILRKRTHQVVYGAQLQRFADLMYGRTFPI